METITVTNLLVRFGVEYNTNIQNERICQSLTSKHESSDIHSHSTKMCYFISAETEHMFEEIEVQELILKLEKECL
jgi:hypothetical protein